jgi:hypothetical protein
LSNAGTVAIRSAKKQVTERAGFGEIHLDPRVDVAPRFPPFR